MSYIYMKNMTTTKMTEAEFKKWVSKKNRQLTKGGEYSMFLSSPKEDLQAVEFALECGWSGWKSGVSLNAIKKRLGLLMGCFKYDLVEIIDKSKIMKPYKDIILRELKKNPQYPPGHKGGKV